MSAPSKGDLRRAIREHGDRKTDEILALFDELLQTEKEWQPRCGKCGYRTPTLLPDWSARCRALELLMAQGWGRPAVQERPPPRSGKLDLTRLSDEELYALLDEGEPEPESSTD